MPIHTGDLDAIDFSEVVTGRALLMVRPGDILLHDFMEPFGLSANALATALHVPANRITAILAGSRRISADTALRLAHYFGTTPQFWLNLQNNYDLRLAETKVGDRVRQDVEVHSRVPA
jgi:addiction module HigA family antidote